MAYKTYVLLDALNSTAPIFQSIGNGQRIKIEKIPVWAPTLRQTFQDKNGISHTIRYKEGSNTIDQREQIDKEKLEANAGWTATEYEDRKFKNGLRITNKIGMQNYLEAHPAFNLFDGFCSDYPNPCYKLLDEEADEKDLNEEMRLRVKAAVKVLGIPLEEKQALLLRLNGSFYAVPTTEAKCENALMLVVDEADDKLLNEILRNDTTKDEEVSILIGRLLTAKTISFIQEPNQVSLLKNGRWVSVKEISGEYPMEERKRYLLEFLTSNAGKALLGDMEAALPSKAVVTKEERVVEVKVSAPIEVREETKVAESTVIDEVDSLTPLGLAEKELIEAIENKSHHLTIKKLQKRVDELKIS